jgi:hypothetical protein
MIPYNCKEEEYLYRLISTVEELTMDLLYDLDLNKFSNIRKINFYCENEIEVKWALNYI